MDYVVHPGNGRQTPTGPIEYIDAGTLASLYHLDPGDYIVSNGPDDWTHIHLHPREDGRYRNIKKLLHDNDEEYYYDTPAFFHKTRDGKVKNSRVVQEQYLDSFRDDDRVERKEKYIL